VRVTTERRGLAFAALAALALIWGYNWVVMKIGVRDASPFVFAAWRTFGGGVVLAMLGLLLRRPMRPAFFGRTLWIGLFQTAGFVGLASWAVVSAGAGQVAMLAYTMPLWVAIIAWPALGERIGTLQALAIILSFAGIACMIGPLHRVAAADFIAVAAGLSWAIGIVLAKRLARAEKIEVFSLTMWQMLCGGAVLVMVAVLVPSHPTAWTPVYILAVTYNIFIATALAYTLFLFVLSVLPAGVTSMGTLANPIVGVFAGWAQLGEVPQKREGIGMLLIVAGLIVLAFADRSLMPRQTHRISDDEEAR
jgi:drug/metabolite transporter (DMT)-like permease